MTDGASGLAAVILSMLFFPTFFQKTFLDFVWGAQDPVWLMIAKRAFLLLPTGALILCLWASIMALLTVVVRQKRVDFIRAFLVTWWDFMKCVFAFWGGFLKFFWVFVVSLYGLLRVIVMGLWYIIQDILLIPFRFISAVAKNVSAPGIPWIAVFLTFFWCLVEAIIFTYVMTPLVTDTLANLTGGELSETLIRVPLFFFLLFVILGSYAVLSAWVEAIRTRNVPAILKITLVEMVAAFVEVLFLYRELVDSLVPWFAQHTAGNFDLGIVGTLSIGFVAWLGVRGLTWFLFASHGVPIITAIIQGSGFKGPEGQKKSAKVDAFAYTESFFEHFKADGDWVKEKADELLGAFILPPLQVVSSTINFFTLIIASKPLFDLPFKSFNDIMRSREILEGKPSRPKVKSKLKIVKPAAEMPEATATEVKQ
jgi:hypothetical protein